MLLIGTPPTYWQGEREYVSGHRGRPDDRCVQDPGGQRCAAQRDEQWAFKLILQARDHLRLLLDAAPEEPRTWTHRGQRIRNERYDVLLRAVIGEGITERDRPCPNWTRDARLDEPWVLENPFLGAEGTRTATPPWLAQADIFIAEHPPGDSLNSGCHDVAAEAHVALACS